MAIQYTRGQVAKIYCTFSVNDTPTDPTNLKITIYYGSTVTVAATNMTKISDGYFYYDFDIPDGASLGVYSALYTGTLSDTNFKQEEEFEVLESVSRTGTATPTGAYCSIQDVKDYLAGVNYSSMSEIDDNFIADMIDATTQAINQYCRQSLVEETIALFMMGRQESEVVLPFFPVTLIANAKMLSGLEVSYTFEDIVYVNTVRYGKSLKTPTPVTSLKDADLVVDVVSGVLQIPWQIDLVTDTFELNMDVTHGFATIPTDLKLVAMKLAAKEIMHVKGDELSDGATSKSVDGYSVSYSGAPFQGRAVQIDKDSEMVLNRYKAHSI